MSPFLYWQPAGALVLYSSEKEGGHIERSHKKIDISKVIDRLGNVRRLMASVLYLNDAQVCMTNPDYKPGHFKLAYNCQNEHSVTWISFINAIKILKWSKYLQFVFKPFK